MAHQLYNNDYKNALSAALAIEMFHNFTLIHDDIMDNATLKEEVQKQCMRNGVITLLYSPGMLC